MEKAASIILGIDPASVIIKKGDTSTLPNSGPSYLSSDISIVTSLVEKCCHGIKKQRFHQALPIEVKGHTELPEADGGILKNSRECLFILFHGEPRQQK